VVFTASQQEYADAILDELDPDQEIFQHRLYRHHCWVL
jgi:TFIIF-interacting CTD phosphatase-like protein